MSGPFFLRNASLTTRSWAVSAEQHELDAKTAEHYCKFAKLLRSFDATEYGTRASEVSTLMASKPLRSTWSSLLRAPTLARTSCRFQGGHGEVPLLLSFRPLFPMGKRINRRNCILFCGI